MALDLGEPVARYRLNPLHEGYTWIPATFIGVFGSSAWLAGRAEAYLTAAGLGGVAVLMGTWFAWSLKRALSEYPLLLFAGGLLYDDGEAKHRVLFDDIVAVRADYRGAHDPRPWARTYAFYVETANASIHIGWRIRHTDRALETLLTLLPNDVAQTNVI